MPDAYALSQPDTRADNAIREVSLSPRAVTIRRRYQGIAMRLVVLCAAYRGIALRPVTTGGVLRHEIALLHRDAELSVTLADDADRHTAAAACVRWAAWFGLPALQDESLALAAPTPRRRSAYLVKRRRRYALRRKPGFVSPAFV